MSFYFFASIFLFVCLFVVSYLRHYVFTGLRFLFFLSFFFLGGGYRIPQVVMSLRKLMGATLP